MFTVVDPATDQRTDLVLEADDDTPVGAVAGAVASLLGRPEAARPQLYVGGRPLDPHVVLHGSGLRPGLVVGLGAPAGGCPGSGPALVEVRVVGGPGAGAVHRLGAGEHTIGVGRGADVPLDDAHAPSRAARVRVGLDGTTTVEAYAGVPVRLGRADLAAAACWPSGGQLEVAAMLLELAAPTLPDGPVEPSPDGARLDYNRPPRLRPPPRQTRFRRPPRPREPERRPLPVVTALVPLLVAGVLVLVLRRWYFLVFGLLSPASLVAGHLHDRRAGRRSHRRRLAEHRAAVAAVEADAGRALAAERAARRLAFPDAAVVLATALGPSRRLWERRRHDADALTVRLGTGDLASEVVLEDPDQPDHRRAQTWTALDVPVTVSLRERGVVGMAGPAEVTRALARWVVVQSAALHAPGDLRVHVLSDLAGGTSWQWLRWLPHAQAGDDEHCTLLGHDAESTARRVAELVGLVSGRREAAARGAVLDGEDVLVVLDGARRLRSLPGLVQVLREGPAVGVHVLCLDTDEPLLPEECQAVVVHASGRLRVEQTGSDVVLAVRPDLVTEAWCERVARALAPLRDVGTGPDGAVLPPRVRLLDLLGLEPPTGAAVAARWAAQGPGLDAVLGVLADGPFSIDLARDGPHALVAGTTGAGKSELLQTLVAALAVRHPPEALTFVLVDYKGGAAFAQCERLPHTVGLVTDLDGHLVERALESLSAELRRRERQLAAAGATDIGDYRRLRNGDPTLAALPRLVIVVDELATLVRELPAFVPGLVGIAARGRSLGLHLVLATQRPGGVVSPEIRANTNLRIALRVTDPGESIDVVDAPDAGHISATTPGRGCARLGHGSLVTFQTARVGGRRPADPGQGPDLWVAAADPASTGRPAPSPPRSATGDGAATDLQLLVEAACAAAAVTGAAPQPSPWLPPLPAHLVLDDLPAPTSGGSAPRPAGAVPAVAFALADLPAEQARRPVCLDLATCSHLYVVGAPRSGRSQVLRTIAGALARACSPDDVHLFGIDCGSGALLPLSGLPHCGAVVTRSEPERATRLVRRLAAELRRRQDVLAAGGFADLSEQRAAVADADRMPHLVVLLDRWEGFAGTLGELDGGGLTDEVFLLLREGASAGLHLVVTGDRSLLAGRVATLADDRLVLRLADRADLALAGINPRTVGDALPPGRGFRSESGVETQVALLAPDPTAAGQARALAEIARLAPAAPAGHRPFRVDVLPARPTFADGWRLRRDDRGPLWGLVGVGGDELRAVGPELAVGAPGFVVGGPAASGRSTVLVTMAHAFLLGGASVVLAAPRSSPLTALEGMPGVLAVFRGTDLPAAGLSRALAGATGPCVVLVDDAERLATCSAAEVLCGVLRRDADDVGRPRGLVLAGSTDELCTGFGGWLAEARRSRQGALLSPRSPTDGDLIGVRLPRSVVGLPVRPGRALVHLGDSLLQTVQVPMTEPAQVRSRTLAGGHTSCSSRSYALRRT